MAMVNMNRGMEAAIKELPMIRRDGRQRTQQREVLGREVRGIAVAELVAVPLVVMLRHLRRDRHLHRRTNTKSDTKQAAPRGGVMVRCHLLKELGGLEMAWTLDGGISRGGVDEYR